MKNKDTKNTVKQKKPINNKKLKVNKKLVLKISVAALLLVAIGVGTFLALDWYYVDTPYDGISMPKHIKIPTYFGRELSAAKVNEALEAEKQALIDQYTTTEEVSKGVITANQNVTITMSAYDYTNNVKGTATISDVSFNSYTITNIGEHKDSKGNKFFPELQDKLIGTEYDLNSGSNTTAKRTLIYTYPTDYSVSSVKGKTVLHEIYITKVTNNVVPEYNDEFFKKNESKIGYSSVKDFEDTMRNTIELNMLWNEIISGTQVIKYPEKKTKPLMEEFDEYYNAYMEQNNLTFEKLLNELQTTENGYFATRKQYAEGTVKEEMVLYEIIQAEKIRMSRDEYKERLTNVAEEAGYGDDVDGFIDDYGKEVAERSAIWEKVKEMIVEKAVRVA